MLAAAALAFAACEDSILDPTRHVEGMVIDETTHQPLDSALVILYEDHEGFLMGNHPLQQMTTDKSGKFHFTFEWKNLIPFRQPAGVMAFFGWQKAPLPVSACHLTTTSWIS